MVFASTYTYRQSGRPRPTLKLGNVVGCSPCPGPGLPLFARRSARPDSRRFRLSLRRTGCEPSRVETIDAVATLGNSTAVARLCTLDFLDP